jgi:hypothetical protein
MFVTRMSFGPSSLRRFAESCETAAFDAPETA